MCRVCIKWAVCAVCAFSVLPNVLLLFIVGCLSPPPRSLQGVSVLWEPRLGYALIGLTSGDLECLTLTLDERRWEW